MSRSHRSEVKAMSIAAVALASLVAGGIDAHAATGPVAKLEAKVLQISGRTLASGAVIPAGTALRPVTLSTDDPDAGPQGPLGLNNDPTTLVQGEAVTVRINGTVVATVVPAMRATALQTDAGAFTALVFSAGGNSYALPQYNQPIAGATRTTGASTLNASGVGSIVTYWYGVLPQRAVVSAGSAFSQVTEFGTITSSGVGDFLLYDADGVRGNGGSSGNEVILQDLKGLPSNGIVGRLNNRAGVDVLATVQFTDGRTLVARAVRYDSFGAYYTSSSYLIDSAALALAGQNIRTVATVVSSTPSGHGLNWQALGFTPRP